MNNSGDIYGKSLQRAEVITDFFVFYWWCFRNNIFMHPQEMKMSIHDVKFMFTTRTVLLCVMMPVTSQFKHNNLKPSVVAELQKPLRPIYKI